MTVFGIETAKTDKMIKFVQETQKRLSLSNPVRNPFQGRVMFQVQKDKLLTVFKLESLWFLVAYRLAFIYPTGVIISSIFKGSLFFPWWFALIGGVILLYNYLASPWFFFWVFKQGAKKEGYEGEFKLLNSKKIVGVVLFGEEA